MDPNMHRLPDQQSPPPHEDTDAMSFIAMPAGRFQHVHVDLVGPLPLARGFTYLLTIVDRFSR